MLMYLPVSPGRAEAQPDDKTVEREHQGMSLTWLHSP